VIQTGANGALGRALLQKCMQGGIEVINIVRKEAHIQELIAFGADEK
jgi:putative NADH-flavin reductase